MQNFYSSFLAHALYHDSTSRVADLDYLEPVTRTAVTAILVEAAAAGHPLMVFETYRSQKRQAFLFDRGATQLRTVGCHGFGLAADIVKDLHGQPSWDGDFGFLGVLARRHGLVWGGNWTGFADMCHVQRIDVDDQPKLFAGTWYPDDNYTPYPEIVST